MRGTKFCGWCVFSDRLPKLICLLLHTRQRNGWSFNSRDIEFGAHQATNGVILQDQRLVTAHSSCPIQCTTFHRGIARQLMQSVTPLSQHHLSNLQGSNNYIGRTFLEGRPSKPRARAFLQTWFPVASQIWIMFLPLFELHNIKFWYRKFYWA